MPRIIASIVPHDQSPVNVSALKRRQFLVSVAGGEQNNRGGGSDPTKLSNQFQSKDRGAAVTCAGEHRSQINFNAT